ncbi:BrnT family toxin [Patescibacteria group bacterium]|nr:BrnT family toxin [Patescibacteria group bacterium]
MKLPAPIAFDWDQGNTDKNWEKHKVHYKDKEAEEIFFIKPLKIFPDKDHSKKEARFVAYGITNNFRKLTVIFTIRNKKIRIISARSQNKKERRQYEK